MKPLAVLGIAVLVLIFTCVAGCTSTTSTTSATSVATPSAPVSTTQAATGTAASTTTAADTGIGTTISVHYNDFACINIPETLGVKYLNPGEKFTIAVGSAGSGTITPNLLVLDVTDCSKLGTAKPVWDSVQKTWVYDGVVPIIKIIDVATWQTKTLTIEDQGYYYICIDDRKESGTSDAVYQVPIKVTRG